MANICYKCKGVLTIDIVCSPPPTKNSSTPYNGIVVGGQATTKCTTTRKSVPLQEKVHPTGESLLLQREFSLFIGRVLIV